MKKLKQTKVSAHLVQSAIALRKGTYVQ